MLSSSPSFIGRSLANSVIWTHFFSTHMLLIILIGIHHLVRIPLAIIMSTALWQLVSYWPKFYWNLFKPDPNRRSIWTIITNPVPPDGPKSKPSGMVCLNAKYYCHSYYQVHGAYANLHQRQEHDLDAATQAASSMYIYEDPLLLSVPYEYLFKQLPDPPEGILLRMFSLGLICFVFLYPILYGTVRLTSRTICKTICSRLKATAQIFIRHGHRRRKRITKMPTLYIRAFATASEHPDENAFSWDSDGIPFVIDNSATGNICNVRKLFVGTLTPTKVTLETADGLTTKTKFVGTMRLTLTCDGNENHTYDVPGCVFDPDSPINLIGIPFLGKYFGSHDTLKSSDEDGTWVKSSATKTTFVWDHGKHERNFRHGESGLPELYLYVGKGYFTAFTTRIQSFLGDKVHFAFSSAFSLNPDKLPTKDVTLADEGAMDWYCPETVDSTIKSSAHCDDEPLTKIEFQLGMDLVYRDGKGNNEAVVYEGASADGLSHTIRLANGTKLAVHDSNLQLLDQPDFSNIPKTPLEYRNEIGKGLSLTEAQALARPRPLSPLQQELMSWHHRLYHLAFRHIFQLANLGFLPKRFLECRNNPPICIACQFGQAHRRPWRSKGKKSGSIRQPEQKEPGDGVSVDQIISAQPGLIPQMAGFLTSDRLWGCTTFVDHVSDYVYVHLMRDLTLAETLLAKAAWEKVLSQAGRQVKHYHADNGRFADNGFIDAINSKDQKITFCGVGAHHQNGIVENKNKILTQGARTLLLHGMRMWPDMIEEILWPFALKAVAERLNKLQINALGQSPESRLHGIELDDIPVKIFHTLFCPIYVLDSRLQNAGGAGPPKWEPRSRIGVYLGHSPFHAGSVALVLNPTTGRVSPQYHVVFDDDFTTVPYMEAGTIPPNWEDLVTYSAEKATTTDFEMAESWLAGPPGAAAADPLTDPYAIVSDQHKRQKALTEAHGFIPGTTDPISASEGASSPPSQPQQESLAAANSFASAGRMDSGRTGVSDDYNNSTPTNISHDSDLEALMMPTKINLYESGLRRSKRIIEQNEKEKAKKRKAHVTFGTAAATKALFGLFSLISLASTFTMPNHRKGYTPTYTENVMNRFHEVNELYDGTLNNVHHFLYSTELSSNECFTFQQAMKQDDKMNFVEAMEKEISDHEERSHWSIVTRSTLPKSSKPIKAIWSFKRKRKPDGELLKHKARLCAHGGMQQWGDNYWETYSPVVNMLSVRLILAIAKIHKLDSKAIDFVLAFPQADLKEDIWMQLPIGFQIDGQTEADSDRHYVLKLNKSLYGLKQASFNWYEKLKTSLEDRNFKPSEIDPCLYIGNGMIVLTYVDDCIIIGPAMTEIDKFVESLKNGPEDFVLTDEGDIDKFLGIEITQLDDRRFKLAQPFLIDRIIAFLEIDANDFEMDTNTKSTPVGKPLLHKDLEGKPRKATWNYRTAVGMLTYLQGNTRPEMSMSVHQTARFCNNPKLSHEKAIKRLGRYLYHTRKEGIIYNPDISKGLECYVDADFAGGWTNADAEDAENVLSRTGMVIMYANCPIYWFSRLQTEIALSTAESEYIALSAALRAVIPCMTMMEEINEVFPLHIDKPNFVCKVHEDNQSCIKMATGTKFSPRTKHIALKYHHFRSHVKKGRINIRYKPSEEQLADILTKPLPNEAFFTLRYMLCGWGYNPTRKG